MTLQTVQISQAPVKQQNPPKLLQQILPNLQKKELPHQSRPLRVLDGPHNKPRSFAVFILLSRRKVSNLDQDHPFQIEQHILLLGTNMQHSSKQQLIN